MVDTKILSKEAKIWSTQKLKGSKFARTPFMRTDTPQAVKSHCHPDAQTKTGFEKYTQLVQQVNWY